MEERRDAIVCNDETKQIAKRNVTRTRLSANNLSDVRAQKRECSCVVVSVCAAMAAPGSGQRATLPLGTEGEHLELRLSIFCSPRSPNKQGECTGKCRHSTDLVWSRLVREQEVGGSNPLAPTTFIESATYSIGRGQRAPGARPL